MTYSHGKFQGQRSVGSGDRVETNGQTDERTEAIALPPSLMWSVTTAMQCTVYRRHTRTVAVPCF